MKILVTGGAGFIGSHIVERLLKDGHSVVVLDNFSSGKEENLFFTKDYTQNANRYTLIKGDICDKETCLKATKGVDAILHQAALRSVPKSMTTPHEYNKVNIDGTLNMLEAARENKVKRFAMASSSSAYGDTDKFPQQETDYPKLISPYALSKLAGEYYCRIFSEHFGVETVCLRYFNVFGPKQALDDEYAVVIPKFIHCILNDQQPPIFGTGKQSRDFTYIDNVVEANILAATTPGIKHEFLNVANGQDNTVLQLVELLNKIIGKTIEPKLLPLRAGDVFRTLADISKIKRVLNFEPKVNFEEGLRRTVAWFKIALNK
ncbi:MAG: SDR family oxidoreductase [Candidatus Omnitrophota bacterium]|jgi:nucleoside-diphosphate-sugar epimerase